MMFQKNERGFSLFELMVVVAILSVAGAFLVPRFLKHQIAKKQEECRANLTSLLQAEKTYRDQNGMFTHDLSLLDWSPKGKGVYEYRFLEISSRSQSRGFIFECSGNIDKDPTLDTANIDETGKIVQTSDDTKH